MDDLQSLSPKERVEAIWRKMNARSDVWLSSVLICLIYISPATRFDHNIILSTFLIVL